jgi:hypothetical protein
MAGPVFVRPVLNRVSGLSTGLKWASQASVSPITTARSGNGKEHRNITYS